MSARRRIWYAINALADWLMPAEKDLRHAQWQLVTAAKHAASKLRVEMHRRTVEPKAEYDILIEETEKYNTAWRKAFKE